jgi:hypothetical protein
MKNSDMPAMPMLNSSSDAYVLKAPANWAHGLTKREMFAMAAMQGLCASLTADDDLSPRELARSAVVNADALLAALEAKQ